MADKRLLKLIQQCRTKQVLDYVKQHGADAPKSDGDNNGPVGGNHKSGAKSKKSKKIESSDEPKFKFNVQRHTDDTIKVCFVILGENWLDSKLFCYLHM